MLTVAAVPGSVVYLALTGHSALAILEVVVLVILLVSAIVIARNMTLVSWIRLTRLDRFIWLPDFIRLQGIERGMEAPPRQLSNHPYIPQYEEFTDGSTFMYNARTWSLLTVGPNDPKLLTELFDGGYVPLKRHEFFYTRSTWMLIPVAVYVPLLATLAMIGAIVVAISIHLYIGLALVVAEFVLLRLLVSRRLLARLYDWSPPWALIAASVVVSLGTLVFVASTGQLLWVVLPLVAMLGVYWRISRKDKDSIQAATRLVLYSPAVMLSVAALLAGLSYLHQTSALSIFAAAALVIWLVAERWQVMFLRWWSDGIHVKGIDTLGIREGVHPASQQSIEAQAIQGPEYSFPEDEKPWFLPRQLMRFSDYGTIAFVAASVPDPFIFAGRPSVEHFYQLLVRMTTSVEDADRETPMLLREMLSLFERHFGEPATPAPPPAFATVGPNPRPADAETIRFSAVPQPIRD